MEKNYSSGRIVASITAIVFAAGAAALVIGPDVTQPDKWTFTTWLTLALIAGTILAGEATHIAFRNRRYLSMLGFVLLAVMGSLVVVGNSVGRQSEAHSATALSAAVKNNLITTKEADLAKAKQRRDEALKQADKQRGSKCRDICKGWEAAADKAKGEIAQLEVEIAAQGARLPEHAKAEGIANVLALLGGDHDKVKVLVENLEPVILAGFFELGSIIAIGFALRPAHAAAQPQVPAQQAPANDTAPEAPAPAPTTPRRKRGPKPKASDKVASFKAAYEARHGKQPTAGEVQAATGVSRATAYRA